MGTQRGKEHQANSDMLSRARAPEHFLKARAKFLGICEILKLTERAWKRLLITPRLGRLRGQAGGGGRLAWQPLLWELAGFIKSEDIASV